jgi:hypothetical protein
MGIGRKLLFVVASGLLAQSLQAQGILMVEQEKSGGKTVSNHIQIDKDHMRAETQSNGAQTAFIFDGPHQVIRMVNVENKSYMEMTKAEMEQMGQQINGALAQMQEQLKNVPPEQRALVEQMMRARGGQVAAAPQPAKIEYRKTGSDKVGQWSCTAYDGYRGQEKVAAVCAVDPKDLGVTPADFEITRQLQEFMKTLAPQAADRIVALGKAEDQGFAGIPIRRTQFKNGAVDSVSELTEFQRQAFPASTFEVPSGFRKESMAGGRGRGR